MRTLKISLLLVSSVFIVIGCQKPGDSSVGLATAPGISLTEPTQPPPPPSGDTTSWTAEATVVSATVGSTPGCGWGTSAGDVRSGVAWRIIVGGSAIWLDEDMRNWPTDDVLYSGQLDGAKFAGSYSAGSNYADYVCQFREASLTGQFTSDSTFDADETLIWGLPGSQTTVTRHWTGLRR